ncbi:MAG: hypothetical protein ACREPV_13300 [Lysobacter sp.]
MSVGKSMIAMLGGLVFLGSAEYAVIQLFQIAPLEAKVAEIEKSRDAALEQLAKCQHTGAACSSSVANEQKCMDVLPSWKSALSECRASLDKYVGNCDVLQSTATLRTQEKHINERIDRLTGHGGLIFGSKPDLTAGEQAALADLSRQRELVHERILSLHTQLKGVSEAK